MKKRILSAVLVLAVTILSVPAIGIPMTFAAGQLGYLTYQRFGGNKQIRITACRTEADGTLKIPETIEGFFVTEIADKAFMNCAYLKEVVIPDTVESIGVKAFYGCKSLTDIQIPGSVTSIGSYAFYDCVSQKRVLVQGGDTRIGAYALGFQNDKNGKPAVIQDALLYCYANSVAERYAVKQNIPYRLVPLLEPTAQSMLLKKAGASIVVTEKTKLTADKVLAQFTNPGIGTIVMKKGVQLPGEAFAGTGCEIQLIDGRLTVDALTLAVEGDLNGDAVVDALDAFLCDSAVNGHKKLTGAYFAAADIDRADGSLNISDFSIILNRAVGKNEK